MIGVFPAVKIWRVVRGVYHGGDIVEIWKRTLKHLSDIQIIGIGCNHSKKIRGDNGACIFEGIVQISKKYSSASAFVFPLLHEKSISFILPSDGKRM